MPTATAENPPGLPVPNPCPSYWHRTLPESLLIPGSTSESRSLPSTADVVVIGSGFAGILTAYELLTGPNPPRSIAMLEARSFCSGASGRNAGHCRPDAFRGYSTYADIHGPDQAMNILKHEKLALIYLKSLIDKHQLDCDFNFCKTLDVALGDDFLEHATRTFQSFKNAGGDTEGIRVLSATEAQGVSRVQSALGAIEWQASSLHTPKLCQGLLEQIIPLGLSLFTETPVTSIIRSPHSVGTWSVNTPQGAILTPIVVHATNAYAPTLVPELFPLFILWRSQAQAYVPPPHLSGSQKLTHSYSLRFSLTHFYSVIQCPNSGLVILGTSRENPDMTEELRAAIKGSKDDSEWSREMSDDAVTTFEKTFNIDRAELSSEEGAQEGWTGILGATLDRVPFVGAVPSKAGQYVIAGFNGHGMAHIPRCAPGLAKLILGSGWAETGLPECFQITEQRISRLLRQIST